MKETCAVVSSLALGVAAGIITSNVFVAALVTIGILCGLKAISSRD